MCHVALNSPKYHYHDNYSEELRICSMIDAFCSLSLNVQYWTFNGTYYWLLLYLHVGSEVAEYVAKYLPQVIKDTNSYKQGNLKQSVTDAFLEIDKTIVSQEVLIFIYFMCICLQDRGFTFETFDIEATWHVVDFSLTKT